MNAPQVICSNSSRNAVAATDKRRQCRQQQPQSLRQLSRETRIQQLLSAAVVAVAPLLLMLSPFPVQAAKLPAVDPASNVGFVTNKEVDKKRQKAKFVRAYDGHVALQNKYTKAWTDVKCDLQVPGLLLLRDASGEVYYLGYGGLKQVDLSDDQVVAAVATDDWENAMKPVEGPGEGGMIERLEMTREGFYQLVSLTSGEDFEAELAPAGANAAARK